VRPEITAMMDFASHPGATKIDQSDFGPTGFLRGLPSTAASLRLRTSSASGKVAAHYRKLVAQNAASGRTMTEDTDDREPVPANHEGPVSLTLVLQDKMRIDMDVEPDFKVALPAPEASPGASPSPTPKVRKTWTVTQELWVN
jgi:hypothetical protein